MSKELLEKVLKTKAENFTEEYVEVEFEKCYMLVEKVMNNLDHEEKELLLKMVDNYDDMHRFVKYFIGEKRLWVKKLLLLMKLD